MAEVYTTDEKPRDTVVVDHNHDTHDKRGLSSGAIVAIVIVALILLFLMFGMPFGGGGGGGDTNVNVPAPTTGQ